MTENATAPDSESETSSKAARAQTTGNPSPRSRRRLFFVILVALLALATLVLGELVVRVYITARGWTPNCYAGSLQLFRPHEELGYDLQPEFHLKSGTWEITTNRDGFRGPELPLEDNERSTRIAILGGSSVFGYLVSDGQEAARLLEERLRNNGQSVDVINAGVPGYNLFQTAARFRDRVAPLKPGIVLIYLGWNDLGYLVSKTPDAERFRRLPVAGSLKRLAGRSSLYGLIAFRLLAQDATLPASRLPTTRPTTSGVAQFRANLKSLLQDIDHAGSRAVVCAQVTVAHPKSSESLHSFLGRTDERRRGMIELGEALRGHLRQVANDAGVRYVDMNEFVSPSSNHLLDYVHLSMHGEQELGRAFEQIVAEEIGRREDGSVRSAAPSP